MGHKNKWQNTDVGRGGKSFEKKSAKKKGGYLTSGSGSKAQKGDLILGDLLLELKSTTKESIVLKKEWLHKIRKAAMEQGKTPILVVAFITMNGDVVNQEEWVCMPSSYFDTMTEREKQ